MVLLTSGQVSFLITSVVVFLFTSALFLSGYAVQQKTVRDLRAAIRPKEVPKEARLYLPPQFAGDAKPSPKEKGRGDGVVIEVKQTQHKKEKELLSVDKTMSGEKAVQQPFISPQDEESAQRSGLYNIPPSSDPETKQKTDNLVEEKPISKAERRRRIKEEIMAGSEEAGFKGYRRRMW